MVAIRINRPGVDVMVREYLNCNMHTEWGFRFLENGEEVAGNRHP
jgi:hypothetical protein